VLFEDPSRPLASGVVEGANYAESGREGFERLLAAVARRLAPRARTARAPDVIGISIAGVGRPDIQKPALRDLDEARARLFPLAAFFLFHDIESAFWAAHEDGRGVVVSAGTGSFAFGADGRGREARCGGWGRYAGDEGSAYWIAIEALRRVLREVDGRERPSRMSALVVRRLGLGAPIELVTWVHAATRSKEEIAALSLDVELAAGEGDAAARSILAAAGAALADLASGVIARLDLGPRPEVVLAGSVLRNSARVRRALVGALRKRRPQVAARVAELSAEQGTVRILADRVARGVAPDLRPRKGAGSVLTAAARRSRLVP
jgi:N-acetylglucosamine kinase-like BadF-type ATPase